MMRVFPTFRYTTEADRCWHDKVPHPGHCRICPGLVIAAVVLFAML
jgi:hypothetical protein